MEDLTAFMGKDEFIHKCIMNLGNHLVGFYALKNAQKSTFCIVKTIEEASYQKIQYPSSHPYPCHEGEDDDGARIEYYVRLDKVIKNDQLLKLLIQSKARIDHSRNQLIYSLSYALSI